MEVKLIKIGDRVVFIDHIMFIDVLDNGCQIHLSNGMVITTSHSWETIATGLNCQSKSIIG